MNQPKRPSFPARLGPPSAQNAVRPVVRPAGNAAPRSTAPMPAPRGVGLDSAAVRGRMVQRLAASGISSAAVLQAMGSVERHLFVDTALVNQAYEDTSLPIGLAQTISKPSVVARMIELLLGAEGARGGLGRVLEIGTGCGYQAAVLGRVAREVYSIERLRGLHEKARNNLRPLRLTNVHLIFGDGMVGYAQGAPYAGIIAAAGGDAVPAAWCDQLAVGGRLVAPMVQSNGQQILLVIDKTPYGFNETVLEAVNFVPLKSGIA
jgi:protein-L-isoaspartate(D-aspartate) O-methyltransferase